MLFGYFIKQSFKFWLSLIIWDKSTLFPIFQVLDYMEKIIGVYHVTEMASRTLI